ncbi:pyridoxal 5'-phosphate synthase glutaminase subunit PdxT [Virgibacillus dakarensis]|uniref:Pyridoxal 5'-phosphate synthase subunit PdxT n=1 Tax=Lentibacillus populi TaxID=1827502 RepID=A0A9W5X5E6_9BACI|nr:pyridoxal 5'-phosphate synthase glutaminase subunit PdxT [Lentibacillus populi]MTW85784.1 pyridoxal 5'-phosphate synthase glutaminase subunit PdxT [Virgibacillus dakarensis]GGB43206.1 pyridoxal 5'-phosphate synthase subunit PdxT [Lentibacillus populi]
MITIGVLALQGAVREHIRSIEAAGAKAMEIKRKEQLAEIDGLILPGGESTTMRRLIDSYGFFSAIQQFGETGKPIFGTCAGLILMAKEIDGQEAHLGLMNMKVARNAFGRQVASFETDLPIVHVANDFNAVFIRAPYILEAGSDVEILATYDDKIVAAKQGHYICTAFHPELTDDNRFMEYFVEMVEQSIKTLAS